MGNKSAIARMIHGLHPRNDVHQCGMVVVDMFHQFRLGVCRTCDENRARAFYGLDNAVKKFLILRSVSAAHGVRLMMDVSGRIVRMEHQRVQFRSAEMKYTGFTVIDPDNGMIMGGHGIPFRVQLSGDGGCGVS
jgi:hypothetical protein